MPEARAELEYAIVVTQRRGTYELRIPELLIVVRASSLQAAFDDVRGRVDEIFDGARAIDALDEVPLPRPLQPLLRRRFPRPSRRGAAR